jgi:hypothetical protein
MNEKIEPCLYDTGKFWNPLTGIASSQQGSLNKIECKEIT